MIIRLFCNKLIIINMQLYNSISAIANLLLCG